MARKSSSSGDDSPELVTLYAPDGREYGAANPAEVTRLKASGYTEKPPAKEEAEKVAAAEDAAVSGPPAPPTL